MRNLRLVSGFVSAAVVVMAPAMAQQVANAASANQPLPADIARALANIQPAVQVEGRTYEPASLQELMQKHKVPSVSLAIFRDGRIVWTRAFGTAAEDRPATVDTLYQAASISKPLAATAALELVEQGRLQLDTPVNQQLTSWRIPDSEIASGDSVTLRHLLSHTGGLTVRGFDGYARGTPVPTVLQILNGTATANSEPIRIASVPGEKWSYSGGGYVVAQQLITDVAGTDFAAVLEWLVLQPLGMARSTFQQPLQPSPASAFAVGHNREGLPIPGDYRVQPELASAGLWTTPTDLARWAIDISNSYNGDVNGLLEPSTARAMLEPRLGDWGLGLSVTGSGEDIRFSHSGVNAGYQSLLIGYPARREGLVIMTNGDNGANLFRSVSMAVGGALGWPRSTPNIIKPLPLSETERNALIGTYKGGPITVTISREGERLLATEKNSGTVEIIQVAEGVLLAPELGSRLEVMRDPSSGGISALSTGALKLERVRGSE